MTDESQGKHVQDPAEPYEADNEVAVEPVTTENDPDAAVTHPEDDYPEHRTGAFVDDKGLDEN